MNYLAIYDRLIEQAKIRNLQHSKDFYTENHHIVPICCGGIDDDSNLVRLTPEEHLLSHLLLAKINPENRSLVHAAAIMTGDRPGFKRNSSKAYGWAKRNHAKLLTGRIVSEETKLKLRGRVVSPETRKKLSDALKGRKYSPETIERFKNDGRKGRKCSDSTKKKLSKSSSGRKHSEEAKSKMRGFKSEETKRKMSESKKGHFVSEETRRKIGETLRKKKLQTQ